MTSRLRTRHLLLATGAAFLMGACSSAGSPGSQSAPTGAASQQQAGGSSQQPAGGASQQPAGGADPCSLLTQAEVDKAVGQPLGPGKQVATLDDCQWTTADFTAGVDVTVSDWDAIKTAATSTGAAPTAIQGVGDEALYKGGGLLYVRKGSEGFLLSINGPHIDSLSDGGLAQEQVLAAAVLGRL